MPQEIGGSEQSSPHGIHQQAVTDGNIVEIKCIRCGYAGLDTDVLNPQQDKKPEEQIGKHCGQYQCAD